MQYFVLQEVVSLTFRQNYFQNPLNFWFEEWTLQSDLFRVHFSKLNATGSWEEVSLNIDVQIYSDSFAHTMPIIVLLFI